MLSYRHAFHAGNFADVLKHIVLVHIIEHLKKKDKPFCYIDTHAGAGMYALNSEPALKNREFDGGIAKLWRQEGLPAGVRRYVDVVGQFNQGNELLRYPGSPLIAASLMRKDDKLFLYDLHSTEFKFLHALVEKDRRIRTFHADGLIDSLGLLPPRERRGLVLIDPSYELSNDYRLVAETLKKMHRRFATGTYALWYPVVERQRIRRLERALQETGIADIALFELAVAPDSKGHGMTASGMIVINPPWALASEMRLELPWLAQALGAEGRGGHRIVSLAPEGIDYAP
ncbi:23S rRNA (adenine(2030)-N(6))-methyltransferase RlmJ [Methylomicrobium sp. Wu6]|uniref:23S rRNA (adenine(2030)-N(6))-methyltransferase RlmJ n=1 Tax=Methylomicrobium sp. Wu6 TaxID=3107928 RepID=UPI002DD62E1C|nr:23S rRNA (adenine(2030)-N(6))-methyltransferase RlmJ [Methylomicrobium sp. Wu6]MEC4750554.1 23S rRNA (adenine(2030)-N(6))-methyltransferase RlmJ [Methylomicrobium sp. Wu6]